MTLAQERLTDAAARLTSAAARFIEAGRIADLTDVQITSGLEDCVNAADPEFPEVSLKIDRPR